jgi:hypothetical protein
MLITVCVRMVYVSVINVIVCDGSLVQCNSGGRIFETLEISKDNTNVW